MHSKFRLPALLALMLVALTVSAQQFVPGRLYTLSPAPANKLVATDNGTLAKPDAEAPAQYWALSELSGSWRLINPFSNLALRAEGAAVGTGENNGSDEAQLWTVTPAGKDTYTLVPTNNPAKAMAVSGGKLVMVDKAKAGKFTIAESAKPGFDPELTYRFHPVTQPSKVLGTGDSGENNALIVAEEVNPDNRGQYWSVKMIDLNDRAVSGGFYTQNWDDGGNNPAIKRLLQWPAQDGVWNNARFRFIPVDGGKAFVITSASKGNMYKLDEKGNLLAAPLDLTDRTAYFTVESVEKPKIDSPVWEDEQVFAINKLPGRATFNPYASEAEMLADAAIDCVYLDCTNGSFIWEYSLRALLKTWAEAKKDGVKVPKIVFLLPFTANADSKTSLINLYNKFYSKAEYADMWFHWQGKPLIMAYPDNLGTTGVEKEIRNYFTFRPGQPDYVAGPRASQQWGWLEVYPTHAFNTTNGRAEQCVVGVAQNARAASGGHCCAFTLPNTYGRSYSKTKGFDTRPDAYLYGWNFQEQWDRAIDEIKPRMIFITGWNEWTSGMWTSAHGWRTHCRLSTSSTGTIAAT